MKLLRLKEAEHFPAELREGIERHNAEAASVEEAHAALEARRVELGDAASLTAGNAGERVKALAKAKVERLALLTRVRALAVEGLAVLRAVQVADNGAMARVAEALRVRGKELRRGMAALGIAEELAVRRASVNDNELNRLRGELAQVGQGHLERVKMVSELLEKTTAEIAAMLKA